LGLPSLQVISVSRTLVRFARNRNLSGYTLAFTFLVVSMLIFYIGVLLR